MAKDGTKVACQNSFGPSSYSLHFKSRVHLIIWQPTKKKRNVRNVSINNEADLPLSIYLNSKVRFVVFVRQPTKKRRNVKNISINNEIYPPFYLPQFQSPVHNIRPAPYKRKIFFFKKKRVFFFYFFKKNE